MNRKGNKQTARTNWPDYHSFDHRLLNHLLPAVHDDHHCL